MTSEQPALILVVDDDYDCREISRLALEKTYRVMTAESAGEAVELLTHEQPACAILDVMMPGQDGFSLFKYLGSMPATSMIPVIILSEINTVAGTSFTPALLAEYLGREPVAFLEKPVSPEHLLDTVSRALIEKRARTDST